MENQFPYRSLLENLTTTVTEKGYDPYEAYAWFFEQQQKQGIHASHYLSSAITSGGHARDNSLRMSEIIQRNTESARLLAEQLVVDNRSISSDSLVEPVFVGKTHWTQAQYMEFWLSTIGGFELKKGTTAVTVDTLRALATTSLDAADVRLDIMVSAAPAAERAAEYFKIADAFGKLVMEQAVETRPMDQLIRLVDADLSLGCQSERVFARKIGIPVMNICLVKEASLQDLEKVNHHLAKDIAPLISFGAAIFDARQNSVRIVLAEETKEPSEAAT